jgi:hypothetical protein
MHLRKCIPYGRELTSILCKDSVLTALTKTDQLMLHREIFSVCSEMYTEHKCRLFVTPVSIENKPLGLNNEHVAMETGDPGSRSRYNN